MSTIPAINVMTCDMLNCTGHSKYVNGTKPGELTCRCVYGFTGENCDTDVDEFALGNPCYYRGYCNNTYGSWSCDCLQGWRGTEHCQEKIDIYENRKCVPGHMGEDCFDTCLNDSMCDPSEECVKVGRGLVCKCKKGFLLPNCTDIDECASSPCDRTSTCVNTPGSYYCDYCASSPCSNSAVCEISNSSFACHCISGWTGTLCNKDVDECLQHRCNNTGLCINSPGSFICNCSNGWEGDFCEKDLNECDDHPCNSTSSCVNSVGSFNCVLFQSAETDESKGNAGMIVGVALGSALGFASLLIAVLIVRYKWFYRKVKDTNEKSVTKQSTKREEFNRSHANQELRYV